MYNAWKEPTESYGRKRAVSFYKGVSLMAQWECWN